jgi:hypothetical protein
LVTAQGAGLVNFGVDLVAQQDFLGGGHVVQFEPSAQVVSGQLEAIPVGKADE